MDIETELQPRADEALGPYIRRVRKARGLSLPDVSRALMSLPKEMRISHPYLSQIETGQVAQPSRDRLVSLASLLRIPGEWLLVKAGYTITPAEPAKGASGLVQQIMLRVEELSVADQKLFLTMLDAVVKQRHDQKHNRS
jgi:transcriptional regulator with XRE-family HTH domain